MEQQFVGYLLDALDERSRREVEAHLELHPEARAKLALLKQALAPLEADLATPAPPPLLAERTIATVAEHICSPDKLPVDLPQAPPVSPAAIRAGRSWWRRVDVMVAASIMLTIVGVGLITLARLRAPSSAAVIVECKNNLRLFFSGLQTYRDVNRRFPNIAEHRPRDVAGIVVPILMEAGTLADDASIRCPGIGAPLVCQLTMNDLRTMSPEDFDKRSPCLSMCYAYSLGYRDAEKVRGPDDAPTDSWSQVPIMADRPPAEGLVQNSLNHGERLGDRFVSGQNVLFADGHVRFLLERTFRPGDDIFLNRDNLVAAGVDAGDIVLGYSSARP